MMRKSIAALFAVGSMMAPVAFNVALASEAKWSCTKDGAELTVSGAKAKEKKKDCEKQGGTWAKAKAKADSGDAAAKQSSGGGGSW